MFFELQAIVMFTKYLISEIDVNRTAVLDVAREYLLFYTIWFCNASSNSNILV